MPSHFVAPHASVWRSRRHFLQMSAGALTGLTLANCASRPDGSSSKLSLYTWSNYTDEVLLNRFKQETGTDVVVDIFDSNETMLAKLQAGGGSAYSIVYPSDYAVGELRKQNLLTELDKSRTRGIENLFPEFQTSADDPGDRYSIPAFWGTTGLIYNQKRLSTPIADWDDLWKQQAALTGHLTLLNDAREVMGIALKRLGYSLNTTNASEIDAAYNTLVELKPTISAFTTDGWRDQVIAGDVWVAMAFSVEAEEVVAENPNLRYVIPKSGASLWTDTMAIPKSAPNLDGAYAWINLMLSPDVVAEAVQRLPLATPNQAAYKLLPEAIRNNATRYPSAEVQKRCERMQTLPAKVTELYDRYWTKLTST